MTTNTLIVGSGTPQCHARPQCVPVSFHLTDCRTWLEYITAYQDPPDIHVSSPPHKLVLCLILDVWLDVAVAHKVIFDVAHRFRKHFTQLRRLSEHCLTLPEHW